MEVVLIACLGTILFLIIFRRVMKIREMEQENQMMQSYMDAMQDFYCGIQEEIEVTRKYRHDLAKHIQTLEKILEEQILDHASKYMDNLKVQYDLLKCQEFCNDEIVNTTLNIKKNQCKEKQIPIEIQVEDVLYNEIQEVDLVSILHNLLDNSIEANERIPEKDNRGIWFHMYKEEDEIVIDMKNRILKGEAVSFQTKKKQKEEHGIGTKIIETLIQKYNGNRTWKIHEQEMIFEDKITLGAISPCGEEA